MEITASVKGPKVVIRKGKTPSYRPVKPAAARFHRHSKTRRSAGSGLIALMVRISFPRVGACTLKMRVDDVRISDRRCHWIRLHEKGLVNITKCRYTITPSGICWSTWMRRGCTTSHPPLPHNQPPPLLTANAMHRNDALRMIKRRGTIACRSSYICSLIHSGHRDHRVHARSGAAAKKRGRWPHASSPINGPDVHPPGIRTISSREKADEWRSVIYDSLQNAALPI